MRCEEEFLGRVEVLGTMAAPPNGGASSPPDENKRSNGDFLGKLEEAEARDEETLKENVRRSRASSWTGWEAELGPPGQTPAAETGPGDQPPPPNATDEKRAEATGLPASAPAPSKPKGKGAAGDKDLHHRHSAEVQAIILLFFSYLAFALCEGFTMSGIVASLSAGLVGSLYCANNMSEEGKALAKRPKVATTVIDLTDD